jgi:hypothetical protein
MKCPFILVVLTLMTGVLNAQDLTGIWRGYFFSGVGFYKQQYKYEVQIDQLKNKALKGVTYSYRTTVFYGKADLHGIYMDKTKNVIIKEDSLLEVRMAGASVACVMTCYLQYYKTGTTEVLEGTFTSINSVDKSDCGSGTVYLERVTESDFTKEDFLVKKEKENEKKKTSPPTVRKTVPKTSPPAVKKTVPKTAPSTSQKQPPVAKKTTPVKPPVQKPKEDTAAQEPVTKVAPVIPPVIKDTTPKRLPPVPPAIKQRETDLVKTIVTNSPDIKIELYDNGEIDGDTITVYHNNGVVVRKKRLSGEPIVINIKATVEDSHHEFVMYADNLGKIPPNTALMILTTGGKRYELTITSSEQKNAKVVIEYKVPGKDAK